MKVGINEVKDILLGETPIVKVYRGEDVIWERGGLPSGYTRVQYLESTGTQYIDTGITPSTGYGFYLDYELPTTNATRMMGSSLRNAGSWGGISLSPWSGGQFSWFGDMYYIGVVIAQNRAQIWDINDVLEHSNGFRLSTPKYHSNDLYGNVYLFNINTDAFVATTELIVYEFRAYDGDAVIQHLVPCLDANNRPCMYDLVTKQPFYNQGTGEFLYA